MALQYPLKNDTVTGLGKFKVVDANGDDAGPIITMPMPAGLTFTDAASYENAETGILGNFIPSGGEQTGQEEQAVGDNLTKEGAKKLGKSILAKVTGNRSRLLLGETPNPNTRALFKQVNMRTFQVAYKMMPTSEDEANNIKDIVKAFRTELYPESTGSGGPNFEIAYKFPNRFRIRFYLGTTDGRFEVEPKLLDAYLTNVTVAYNSSSQAVMAQRGSGLNFSETDLNLTFLESKTLFGSDVRNKGH